jgi:hypothetical protein
MLRSLILSRFKTQSHGTKPIGIFSTIFRFIFTKDALLVGFAVYAVIRTKRILFGDDLNDSVYTAAAAGAVNAPRTTADTAASTSCRQCSLSVDLFGVCSMANEWDWRQDVQIKNCKSLIIDV